MKYKGPEDFKNLKTDTATPHILFPEFATTIMTNMEEEAKWKETFMKLIDNTYAEVGSKSHFGDMKEWDKTLMDHSWLLETIQQACFAYIGALGVDPHAYKFYVRKMWPAILEKGGDVGPHAHYGSDLSGVLWVDIPDSDTSLDVNTEDSVGGNFNFKNIYHGPTRNIPLGTDAHWFCGNISYHLIPKEGMMCVFPGDLPHGVEPYNGRGRRVSLSFDVTVARDPNFELRSNEHTTPPPETWIELT